MLLEFVMLSFYMVHIVNMHAAHSGEAYFSRALTLVIGSCILLLFFFVANLLGARKVLTYAHASVRVAAAQSRAISAHVTLKSAQLLLASGSAQLLSSTRTSVQDGGSEWQPLAVESERAGTFLVRITLSLPQVSCLRLRLGCERLRHLGAMLHCKYSIAHALLPTLTRCCIGSAQPHTQPSPEGWTFIAQARICHALQS
jgi:hypothetical protein